MRFVLVGAVMLAACSASHPSAVDCDIRTSTTTVRIAPRSRLDVLFVVDPAMVGLVEPVEAEVAGIGRALVTGDVDADGIADLPDEFDLRAAVITSDLGAGGYPYFGCGAGRDGVPITCGDSSAIVEMNRADPIDAERVARELGCRASAAIEVGACGVRQPVNAALLFLDRFEDFGRDGALLWVVVISAGDDCTAADPRLFDETAMTYREGPCVGGADLLVPAVDIADGLVGRVEYPDLLELTILGGAPPALVGPWGTVTDEMLRVDPAMPPGCGGGSDIAARAPVRLARIANRLDETGSNGRLFSMCRPGWSRAVEAVFDRVVHDYDAGCRRSLTRNADGLVECTLTERLDPASGVEDCSSLPGREPIDTAAAGRSTCRVTQLRAVDHHPAGLGWYYDDFSGDGVDVCGEDAGRIVVPHDVEPLPGSLLTLDCVVEASPGCR